MKKPTTNRKTAKTPKKPAPKTTSTKRAATRKKSTASVEPAPYKLVYFRDRSTAVVSHWCEVGIPMFKGGFDRCIEVQERLCDETKGLHTCHLGAEEINDRIKELQASWSSG